MFWRLLGAANAIGYGVILIAYMATDYEPKDVLVGYALFCVVLRGLTSATNGNTK